MGVTTASLSKSRKLGTQTPAKVGKGEDERYEYDEDVFKEDLSDMVVLLTWLSTT